MSQWSQASGSKDPRARENVVADPLFRALQGSRKASCCRLQPVTLLLLIGLLPGFSVPAQNGQGTMYRRAGGAPGRGRFAQTNAPANTDPATAQPTNAAAVVDARPAEPTDAPDKKLPPSDLELHPYRRFGEKQCYLNALLAWEKLDVAQRRRTPNPMPVWRSFHGTLLSVVDSGWTKLSSPAASPSSHGTFQVVDSGLLLGQDKEVVFVKNHPAQTNLTVGQSVAFHAIKYGSYSSTNAAGTVLQVDAYDYGIPFHPKFPPVNIQSNLAALYRGQRLKAIDDQIDSLQKTDDQLRDQENNVKRLRSASRQPPRAVAYEQYQINQLEAQRAAIGQQLSALKNQKAQIEGAAPSGPKARSNISTNSP